MVSHHRNGATAPPPPSSTLSPNTIPTPAGSRRVASASQIDGNRPRREASATHVDHRPRREVSASHADRRSRRHSTHVHDTVHSPPLAGLRQRWSTIRERMRGAFEHVHFHHRHTGHTTREPDPAPPTPAPEVHGTLLDASAYPHVFDDIVHFSTTASLAVLRQTCTTLRERTRSALFEHVLFLPVRSKVHILTGAPPHLYLGSFDVKLDHQTMGVELAALLAELQHTRILDVYQLPTTATLSALSMPRLEVIRRVVDPYAGKARYRYVAQYPPAHTVVDHVDLSAKHAGAMSNASPLCVLPPYGTKHHILHLAWDQWDPSVARTELRPCVETESKTVVLHPYGVGQGPAQHFQPLAALLASEWRGTVVGAEGMQLPDSSAFSATPDSPGVRFETYDAWVARFGSPPEPAPETMVSYYESAEMRRSRLKAETWSPGHEGETGPVIIW